MEVRIVWMSGGHIPPGLWFGTREKNDAGWALAYGAVRIRHNLKSRFQGIGCDTADPRKIHRSENPVRRVYCGRRADDVGFGGFVKEKGKNQVPTRGLGHLEKWKEHSMERALIRGNRAFCYGCPELHNPEGWREQRALSAYASRRVKD